MAEPTSSDASRRADWRRRVGGVTLIVLGLGGVLVGASAYLDAWTTSQAWNASEEARALERAETAPTPIWVEAATPEAEPVALAPLPTPVPASAATTPVPTPAVTEVVPLASVEQLALSSTEFRFLEPPEPGAHARLAVVVRNTGVGPSGRILLGIPASWFESYRIIGSVPAVAEDRTDDEGRRTFNYPSIPGGEQATFELHVAPTVEETRPPTVEVLLSDGEAIGSAKPPTLAPPPRPGPVMALDIPSLKMHSGVVQTKWEPPPFTVGQIRDSAAITKGNTVLIGHLTGAAGNVFAKLDKLTPGDKVTATSRGVTYDFVVSKIYVSTNIDSSPMDAAEDGRLTLMTCAGVWNPITRDYSERLWVVAESPEKAEKTVATVKAAATAQAYVMATAAVLEPPATPKPTLTPTAVPTPFVGEPSAAGGLGNTRADLEKALGLPTGETSGKLVVFKREGVEYRALFTPEEPRAVLLSAIFAANARMTFEAAARESRRLFPQDATAKGAPEGGPQLVVERFTSATLRNVFDEERFTAAYVKNEQGFVTRMVLGLGDDFPALLEQAQR